MSEFARPLTEPIEAGGASPELGTKQGTAVLIHVVEPDEFLFFVRDDIPTIPYPDTICPIGGGRNPGESPESALRRELGEEIFDSRYCRPYAFGDFHHLAQLADDRPGKIDVFGYAIMQRPPIYTIEGQRLIYLSREATLRIAFPYTFTGIVHWFAKTSPLHDGTSPYQLVNRQSYQTQPENGQTVPLSNGHRFSGLGSLMIPSDAYRNGRR